MKKFKLILIAGLLILIGIYLRYTNDTSKEVELSKDDLGNLYKEYVITKQENGTRLKDYFNKKEVFIEKVGVTNIINVEDNYELLQADNEIYLKTMNRIKITKGVTRKKIGENYIFEDNEKFGVLDKNLNILIDPLYDGLFMAEKSNLLLAKKNEKYGYLNLKGEVVIPFEYEMGAIEKNGLMVVKKNNKIGVINQNNKEIIKFDYDAIYYDDTDRFIVLKNSEYFLIDSSGKIDRIDASWMGVQKNEKIYYERDGKFGIFDFKKEYITENIYSELSQNYNKLIIAMKFDKYGLINNKGETKLPFAYEYILPLGKNYFKVGTNISEYVSLVNQEGEVISKQIYDDFIELNEKNVVAIRDNQLILMDQKGKEVKEIDSIINFNNNMLLYTKDAKNILRKL